MSIGSGQSGAKRLLDFFIKNISGATINPATEEGQDRIVDNLRDGIEINLDGGTPILQMEEGEVGTVDTNLAKILGRSPIVENGKLKTSNSNFDDISGVYKLIGANSEAKVFTKGFSTCSIQITGTWAGTATFEISADGGNFVAVAGINAATNTIAYSTTGNGIFRFNVTGLNCIRVRFSTYTSGIMIVFFGLSSGPQWQPFAQSATGAVTTADGNIPFIAPSQMYETGFELEAARIIEPTINPTQPATYAQNKFAKWPQIFRRLRVEIGGSQKLPFAQEANTNKMIVTEPELRAVLELMYVELQNIRNVLLGDNNNLN